MLATTFAAMVYALSIGDVLALIGLVQDILKTVFSSDAKNEVQSAINFIKCLAVALKIIQVDWQRVSQSISSKFQRIAPTTSKIFMRTSISV